MEEQKQPNEINLLHQDDIKPDIQKDFSEIPKKTGLPKWVIILLITIGIIIIGIIGYFTYQSYFILNEPIDEPIVCAEKDARICPNGSSVSRIAPDCEFAECPEEKIKFNSHQFLNDLKNKIIEENWLKIDKYNILEIKERKEELSGSIWVIGEDIELLNGYYLSYNPAYGEKNINIVDGVIKIKDYLEENGYEINKANTYYVDGEQNFWSRENGRGGRMGFEKENIKCILRSFYLGLTEHGFIISCNDINNIITPTIYKEIYKSVNPPEINIYSYSVNIDKYEDNFVIGGVSDTFIGAGAKYFWKKENGKWKVISTIQAEYWQCEVLLNEKVPPSIVNECLYYNRDPQVFIDNYSELYKENFPE